MNRIDTALVTTALRQILFRTFYRGVWVPLICLSFALPAVAQLTVPIPPSVATDMSESAYALRSTVVPYKLHTLSRTEPERILRQAEDPTSSALRVLELPTIEYHQLPESNLWGEWLTMPSGQSAWRGVLQLEEAGWNTLYFDNYELSPGDMLLIANEEGELRGAFTEANNVASRSLTTAPLYGERLVVYYYPAMGERICLPWQLSGVTTALLSTVGEELPPAVGGHRNPSSPWFVIRGLECAEATVRHPEVERIARSEVLLVVRGRSFSSGTLINNSRQDGEALVLTAAHCVNGNYKHSKDMDYVRESAKRTIFFFNYFSPTGDPLVNGIQEQTLAGAEVVAYNESHDMCLLRITGLKPNVPEGQCAIPQSYRPYFAGWNAERDFPAPVIGIHHPQASVRRYNRADQKPLLESYILSGIPVQWSNSHLHIKEWNVGTTAPGSSGSGLFDKEHRLVGALTGGSSYCSTPYNDYYYALSEAFTGYSDDQCLQPHLAPASDRTTLEGLDPFAAKPSVRLSHQLYSLMRDSVAVRSFDPAVEGVAVRYDIDTSVQYLGTVLVMGAIKEWTSIALSIYNSDEEGRVGKQIYQQTLQAPMYMRMSEDEKVLDERNMSDAFQAFFPISGSDEPLTLPAGSYYIALEGLEGAPLPTPLLLSKVQPHTTPYAWHLVGSSWQPAMLGGHSYLGHYWVDPIVLGNIKGMGTGSFVTPEEPRVMLAGERLFLLLPDSWLKDGAPVQLELYSSAGQRLLLQSITTGRSSLSLAHYALQSGVYIVHLTSAEARYSCKLFCP